MVDIKPRTVGLSGDMLTLGGRSVCAIRYTTPEMMICWVKEVDATTKEKELLVAEIKRYYSQIMYELDKTVDQ